MAGARWFQSGVWNNLQVATLENCGYTLLFGADLVTDECTHIPQTQLSPVLTAVMWGLQQTSWMQKSSWRSSKHSDHAGRQDVQASCKEWFEQTAWILAAQATQIVWGKGNTGQTKGKKKRIQPILLLTWLLIPCTNGFCQFVLEFLFHKIGIIALNMYTVK